MKNDRGFTLLEMLIVVGIMSTLLAIAVLSVYTIRPGWDANSAVRSIVWDMNYVRTLAITRNKLYRMEFSNPSSGRYVIREDTNNNGTWVTVVKTIDLPAGITFGVTGGIAGPPDASGAPAAVDATDGISFTGKQGVFYSNGSADTGTVYIIPSADQTNGRTDRIKAVMVRFGTTSNVHAYKYGAGVWTDF